VACPPYTCTGAPRWHRLAVPAASPCATAALRASGLIKGNMLYGALEAVGCHIRHLQDPPPTRWRHAAVHLSSDRAGLLLEPRLAQSLFLLSNLFLLSSPASHFLPATPIEFCFEGQGLETRFPSCTSPLGAVQSHASRVSFFFFFFCPCRSNTALLFIRGGPDGSRSSFGAPQFVRAMWAPAPLVAGERRLRTA
jgi:hypothetical protein